MAPIILHSDLNCFYASVEINENPALAGKKIAVCGSTEDRHGIVLTASYPAKRSGVKTGMANWQARQACPDLICVPPHYDLYVKYSKLVRRIYHCSYSRLSFGNPDWKRRLCVSSRLVSPAQKHSERRTGADADPATRIGQ